MNEKVSHTFRAVSNDCFVYPHEISSLKIKIKGYTYLDMLNKSTDEFHTKLSKTKDICAVYQNIIAYKFSKSV